MVKKGLCSPQMPEIRGSLRTIGSPKLSIYIWKGEEKWGEATTNPKSPTLMRLCVKPQFNTAAKARWTIPSRCARAHFCQRPRDQQTKPDAETRGGSTAWIGSTVWTRGPQGEMCLALQPRRDNFCQFRP